VSGRTVLVLDGPNLDRLGVRQPEIYGRVGREAVLARLRELGAELGLAVAGLVVNAGGYSHGSVALRDALAGAGMPFVEIHVSNVAAREPFRHTSLLSAVAAGVVYGFGPQGYELALRGLAGVLAGTSGPGRGRGV
jgi:3-dehydroquinate dehydratase-2